MFLPSVHDFTRFFPVPSPFHWTSIAISSLILEDPTTLYVSALVTKQHELWTYGLSALVVGLAIGDSGLYTLGVITRKLNRPWTKPQTRSRGLAVSVFLARFVPGLRILVYGYAGYHQFSFVKFFLINILSSFLWSVLLLLTGSTFYSWLGTPGLCLLLFMLLGVALYRRFFASSRKTPSAVANPVER